MTYCVALKLNKGLVFLADTRSNAGVDNIVRVKKLFTWTSEGRALAMMTAGNLGITQAVVSELEEEERKQAGKKKDTLLTVASLYDVASLVAAKMRKTQKKYGPGLAARGEDSSASIILGGQYPDEPPRLFLVYAAGNFIEAKCDTPYFQIGEHKYGKPIIDRVITPETEMQDGLICALLSMDSTIRSNLTVGMPLDFATLPTDAYEFDQIRRIEADNENFKRFSELWSQHLSGAFKNMRTLPL